MYVCSYAVGIPKVLKYYKEDDMEMIVMELLGPSLEILLEKNKRPFSPKCILRLADEIVKQSNRSNDLSKFIKKGLFIEILSQKIS